MRGLMGMPPLPPSRTRLLFGAAVVLAGLIGASAAFYASMGLYGLNEIIRHGAVF